MTAGTDGKTIDGFSKRTVESLIARLKTEKYHPKPVRRTYRKRKTEKCALWVFRLLRISLYRKL